MKRLLILALLICSLTTFSQPENITLTENVKYSHLSLVFLSEGEVNWLEVPVDEIEGIAYRVLITRSDIYNAVFLEKVTFGIEGCCKEILFKKELPVEVLFDLFNITGETAGVTFLKWCAPGTFILGIYDHKFVVSVLDDSIVSVNRTE